MLILFKYERSKGQLFVLSWARVRRVDRGSLVSELYTVSGMVFVTLVCCRLLMYVLTMVVGMGFMFFLNFGVIYGVGVCVNVCGVVCVVVCCLFLTFGVICCLVM